MDILQQKNINNNRFLWILISIIILIGIYFALTGFAEFFNVAVAGEIRRYPTHWGATNKLPWYNQNSNIYSSYNFISGVLFLIVTILTLCGKIQKKKSLATIGALFIILLVLAEFISSSIKATSFN